MRFSIKIALIFSLVFFLHGDAVYADATNCSDEKKTQCSGLGRPCNEQPTPKNVCSGALLKTGTTSDLCRTQCNSKGFDIGTYRASPEFDGSPPCWTGEKAPCCCSGSGSVQTIPPTQGRVSVPPTGSLEENVKKYRDAAAKNAKFGHGQLPIYVGNVIKILLGLLGIIFLSMVVYAGFKWLTAAGDEKKVADAINIINHALFGLAIVVGAYVITKAVVDVITKAAV